MEGLWREGFLKKVALSRETTSEGVIDSGSGESNAIDVFSTLQCLEKM